MSEESKADPATHPWNSLFWLISGIVFIVYSFGFPLLHYRTCSAEQSGGSVPGHITINGQQSTQSTSGVDVPLGKFTLAPTIPSQTSIEQSAEATYYPPKEPHSWWDRTFCESKASDFFIGLFTLILAISTIGLWWQTERLAEGAEEQIKAVKASVDAIKTTEMARIMITKIEIPDGTKGIDRPAHFRVYFQNFGKTPGFIHRTSLHFYPARSRTFPDTIVGPIRGGVYENGFMLPPSDVPKDCVDRYGSDILLAGEIDRMVADSSEQLFVWGFVEYSPVFAEVWEAGFAYRINLAPGKHQKNVFVGGATYWYSRKKQET